MELTAILHRIQPITPFRTARDEKREQINVYVRVRDEGVVGYGEAAPLSFYGEDPRTVVALLDNLALHLIPHSVSSVPEIEALWNECWPLLNPSRAAQCALDLALWDLVGKKLDITASQLAHHARPKELTSFVTVGIAPLEELNEKIEALADYPLIKLKMSGGMDDQLFQLVRRKTSARIAIDANCSWGGRNVPALTEDLQGTRLLFIEQPIPPEEDHRMKYMTLAAALPIIADESCVIREDVARLQVHFSGVNIKLSKCGGITPALQMITELKRQQHIAMVGCMLESSCGIAAAAVIAQKCDYADLDGAWLLEEDPFIGTELKTGILEVSGGPGLGVEPRPGLFPLL